MPANYDVLQRRYKPEPEDVFYLGISVRKEATEVVRAVSM